MPRNSLRIVLDTNILVRAIINLRSESGCIVEACELRRVVPLLSDPPLREYRLILGDPKLCARYPQLERPEVAVAIERLLYVGDMYRHVKARFVYARDPKDAHLIELAIAGRATHLISTDDDLLALPAGRGDASRRFRQRLPNLRVIAPQAFVRLYWSDLRRD